MIQSQNAKIKNKLNIHFAFSERPDPHQLKFVQFFSTQPISNYFTLQRYIALLFSLFGNWAVQRSASQTGPKKSKIKSYKFLTFFIA